MSSFAIYMIGLVLVLGGLTYLAIILGAPPIFIGIGVVVLLGLGIMSAVRKTREVDDTPTSD